METKLCTQTPEVLVLFVFTTREPGLIRARSVRRRPRRLTTCTLFPLYLYRYRIHTPDTLKPADLVGVNKDSYLILDTLPAEYDARVKAMEVDEKPTEDYSDIGGLDKQIQELREAVVLPMTHAEKFATLGIRAPKGVLLYGPPGTGKTLIAKACAAQVRIGAFPNPNTVCPYKTDTFFFICYPDCLLIHITKYTHTQDSQDSHFPFTSQTSACFLKLAGPQLVQMFIGDGAKLTEEVVESEEASPLHYFHRRNRRDWHEAVRQRHERRPRSTKDDAGVVEPARRVFQ